MTQEQTTIAVFFLNIFEAVYELLSIEFLGVPFYTYLLSISFISLLLSFLSSRAKRKE